MDFYRTQYLPNDMVKKFLFDETYKIKRVLIICLIKRSLDLFFSSVLLASKMGEAHDVKNMKRNSAFWNLLQNHDRWIRTSKTLVANVLEGDGRDVFVRIHLLPLS